MRVEPRKLSLEGYRGLLDEIARLAYNIIYDLRESTFERLDLAEPDEVPQSGIEWLEKIVEILSKLASVLYDIDRQPHVRLSTRDELRFSWEVRRPGKAFLQQLQYAQVPRPESDRHSSIGIPSRFSLGRLPLRLPDEIHQVDTNCYENQLIAQFLEGMARKLRTLRAQATRARESNLVDQSLVILDSLLSLSFLKGVTPLRHPPRPSLVLLRNFRYRQFHELFRRFNGALRVRYGTDEQIDFLRLTTLQLFKTYEAWVFFKVIEATELATRGHAQAEDRVFSMLRFDDLVVRLEEGSRIEVDTDEGGKVVVTYQPSFSHLAEGKRYSVSLPKRPDITVELAGADSAIVFDAKYRLDSETEDDRTAGFGEPKESDINKMHVYRDALRIGEDKRFAPAAYVIYPGRVEKLYDDGRLGAIPMRPGTSIDQLALALRRGLELE